MHGKQFFSKVHNLKYIKNGINIFLHVSDTFYHMYQIAINGKNNHSRYQPDVI